MEGGGEGEGEGRRGGGGGGGEEGSVLDVEVRIHLADEKTGSADTG